MQSHEFRRASILLQNAIQNKAAFDQIAVKRIKEILLKEPKQRLPQELRYIQEVLVPRVQYFQNFRDKLTDESYQHLFRQLQLEEHQPLDVLFNQGDLGLKMYIILEGEVAVLVKSVVQHTHYTPYFKRCNNIYYSSEDIKSFSDIVKSRFMTFKQVATIKQFETFGEVALEQRIPRTATIITKEKCTFLVITIESYQKILKNQIDELHKKKIEFIIQRYPFNLLDEAVLFQLLHGSEELNMKSHCTLYKQNELANYFYLILSGEVLVQKISNNSQCKLQTIGNYCQGQMIGDFEYYEHLFHNKALLRRTRAVTQSESIIIKISLKHFQELTQPFLDLEEFKGHLSQKYQQKDQLQQSRNVKQKCLTEHNGVLTKEQEQLLEFIREQRKIRLPSNYTKLLESTRNEPKLIYDDLFQTPRTTRILTKKNSEKDIHLTQNFDLMSRFAKKLKKQITTSCRKISIKDNEFHSISRIKTEEDNIYTPFFNSPKSRKFTKQIFFPQ